MTATARRRLIQGGLSAPSRGKSAPPDQNPRKKSPGAVFPGPTIAIAKASTGGGNGAAAPVLLSRIYAGGAKRYVRRAAKGIKQDPANNNELGCLPMMAAVHTAAARLRASPFGYACERTGDAIDCIIPAVLVAVIVGGCTLMALGYIN